MYLPDSGILRSLFAIFFKILTVRHFTALRLTIAAALSLVSGAPVSAQYVPSGCPGQWIQYGGGLACQCPDGSLASGWPTITCGGYQQQPSGVNCGYGYVCPEGTTCCGTMCCNEGYYCSKYGCTPYGAVDCGRSYCLPGQQCSVGGSCIPAGTVDCGSYYCQPNEKCAIGRRGCLPSNVVDCGPTVNGTCEPGQVCWTAPADIPGIVKKGAKLCPTPEVKAGYEKKITELEQEKKRLAAQRVIDANNTKLTDAEIQLRLEADKQRLAALTKEIQGGQRAVPPPPPNWAEKQLQALANGQDPQKLGLVYPSPPPAPVIKTYQQELNEVQLQALARGEDPAKAEQEWALKQLQARGTTSQATSGVQQVPPLASSPSSPAASGPLSLDVKRLEPYQFEQRSVSGTIPSLPSASSPPTQPQSVAIPNLGVCSTFPDSSLSKGGCPPPMTPEEAAAAEKRQLEIAKEFKEKEADRLAREKALNDELVKKEKEEADRKAAAAAAKFYEVSDVDDRDCRGFHLDFFSRQQYCVMQGQSGSQCQVCTTKKRCERLLLKDKCTEGVKTCEIVCR